MTRAHAAGDPRNVAPAVEGFAAILAAIAAVESLASEEGESSLVARAGRKDAPAWLRDLAHGLDEEVDYARRHAVRIRRFDLVPLLERLRESIEARLAERFGERNSAPGARSIVRFREDAANFRRALARGA